MPNVKWRRVTKKLLRKYFRRASRPLNAQSLDSLLTEGALLATQSRSLVFEAYLESILEHQGIEKVSYLLSKSTDSDIAPEKQINYFSIHDEEALKTVLDRDNSLPIVTVTLCKGRGPFRTLPSHTIRYSDYLSLLVGSLFGRLWVVSVVGAPISSIPHEFKTTRSLRRMLKIDLFHNLKLVRGVPFQRINAQIPAVLSGNSYERELRVLAQRDKTSPKALHKKARTKLKQIAANPRGWMFTPGALTARFILKRLFHDVQVLGLESLIEKTRTETVILVPLHRSHLDYVIISSVLHDAGMNIPLIAAGVNLNFWPFGWIARSLGAYFVSRGDRSDRLNALVLKRYVTYLVQRGHLQEFFIEGGRSRSGRMRTPKMGLLTTIIESDQNKSKPDVHFIPVTISYEQVVEDQQLGRENSGASKTRESFLTLVKAFRVFQKKYREVVVQFGEAVELQTFLEKQPKGSSIRATTRALGLELTHRIEDQSSLTLRSLACVSLLAAPQYGMNRNELERSMRSLLKIIGLWFTSRGLTLEQHMTPPLRSFHASEGYLAIELLHDIIREEEFLGSRLVFIPGNSRFRAEFYKNASLHSLLAWGFLSLVLTGKSSINQQDLWEIYQHFSYDFLLKPWEQYREEFASFLKVCKAEKLLEGNLDDQISITSYGSELLLPTLLLSSVQSRLWILTQLTVSSEQFRSRHAFLSFLQKEWGSAKYLGIYDRTEAGSYSALSLAYEQLIHQGVLTENLSPTFQIKFENEARVEEIRNYLLDLVRRSEEWEVQARIRLAQHF